MYYQAGAILEEGKWAEVATEKVLNLAGIPTRFATDWEDHNLKVDLWSTIDGKTLPIQLSTNRLAICGDKGKRAISRGIVPLYIDPLELEKAVDTGNVKSVAAYVVEKVRTIMIEPRLNFHPRYA